MRHLLACPLLVGAAPAVAAEMLLLHWATEPRQEGRILLLLDRAHPRGRRAPEQNLH